MNKTDGNRLAHSSPSRPKAWWWLMLLLGISVVAIWVVPWPRPSIRPEPPSELRSNLSQREGRLFALGTTEPFTGWMMDRYLDATLRSRSWISNGILHGISEGWFTNGVRQVQEHFVNGVSEGAITKWYPNGSKLSEGIARAGKLEGVFRRLHENGQLAEEVSLREGQPHGISRAWFPNGDLKAEVTLNSGTVISQKFFKEGEFPADTALAKAGGDR